MLCGAFGRTLMVLYDIFIGVQLNHDLPINLCTSCATREYPGTLGTLGLLP